MPTLSAIFKLTDRYSPAADKIDSSTRRIENSIDRAGRSAGSFSARLGASGGAVSRLAAGVSNLAGKYLNLQTAEKVMGISDTYANAGAQLSQLTGGLQQQKQLQNEIFAAAERSRGNYPDMADHAAKLAAASGEQFGNTNNLVKYTETMQKMFRIGGTGAQDQAAAWAQMQQSMVGGKLQGQDFGALVAAAPLVEQAIAQYMGKSTDDIKSLGTAGEITSQALINSVLAYSQTADQQMSSLPMTFSDCWNEIKTGAMEAFGSAFENMSGILNAQGIQAVIHGVIGGFGILAQAANGVLNAVSAVVQFFTENWTVIRPIILGIAAAMGLSFLSTGFGVLSGNIAAALAAVFTFNSALMASPVMWVLFAIVAVIAALYIVVAVINKLTGQSISATGLIAGAIFWLGALLFNAAIGVFNAIIQALWTIFIDPFLSIIEFVLNAANGGFNSFGGAVANVIGQIISWFLSLGKIVTKIIDAIFGTDWTSDLDSLQDSVLKWGKNDKAITISREAPAISTRFDMTDAWDAGNAWGTDLQSSITSAFKGFGGDDTSNGLAALDNLKNGLNTPAGTPGDPTTVQGTGSGGTMSVDIADQDLQYLRDLAEKDYIAKFSTATLAPNISVSVNNSTGEDLDGLKNRIAMILREGIAMAAEGSYA